MCIDVKQNKVNITAFLQERCYINSNYFMKACWNRKFKILGVRQGLILRIWEFDYLDELFFLTDTFPLSAATVEVWQLDPTTTPVTENSKALDIQQSKHNLLSNLSI